MRWATLLFPLGAIAGAVLLGVVVLLTVWLAGGLRTTGEYLDWNVVIALSNTVIAVATVGALAAVGYGLAQAQAARRNERLSLMPYLRVDRGFHGGPHHPGFSPPEVGHVFGAEDFGNAADMDGLSALRPEPGQDAYELALWVTNAQRAPLGSAFQVRVGLYVGWRLGDEPEANRAEVAVDFAYVEPGTTTAVRLANIRPDVRELVVSVFAVSYHGMYLDRPLFNRHGALEFYYDAETKEVQNGRSYGLGEAT